MSWNVNGIRAVLRKGFLDILTAEKPDILCLQEIKISQADQLKAQFDFPEYREVWFSAQKRGYSGTATLIHNSLTPRLFGFTNGLKQKKIDIEGRLQTLEFDRFYLVNSYFPNSRHDLSRLDYKQEYNQAVRHLLTKLVKKKPVILTGDLNVAPEAIDLANPKENEGNPGFHPREREDFARLLKAGFIDTFRYLHPETKKYSWWSYKFHARQRNIGWRIDHFCVSQDLKNKLVKAEINDKIMGSDHCPITLSLKI